MPAKGDWQRVDTGGISRLKDLGARGCCLVGHPEYYRRFGFQNIRGLGHEGVPEEVFFALSLAGHIPRGIVEFHVGFKADGQGVPADVSVAASRHQNLG